MRHVGLLGGMITDVRALDSKSAEALDQTAEACLKMWERARALGDEEPSGPAPTTSNAPKPACVNDFECDAGKWCDAGIDTKGNVCRAKLDKGQSCGKAGSVGNDHKCKSGECSGFPKYECR